jgi:hypothetical protein
MTERKETKASPQLHHMAQRDIDSPPAPSNPDGWQGAEIATFMRDKWDDPGNPGAPIDSYLGRSKRDDADQQSDEGRREATGRK